MHAKKYIMVCSPESEMVTDVIAILRKSFEDYHGYPHYAIGRVCFADEEEVTVKTFNRYRYIPFGSIMFEKKHAERIRGYDETLSKWGGDDNNFRSRLDMTGVKELYFNEAMMAHHDIDNHEEKPAEASLSKNARTMSCAISSSPKPPSPTVRTGGATSTKWFTTGATSRWQRNSWNVFQEKTS